MNFFRFSHIFIIFYTHPSSLPIELTFHLVSIYYSLNDFLQHFLYCGSNFLLTNILFLFLI